MHALRVAQAVEVAVALRGASSLPRRRETRRRGLAACSPCCAAPRARAAARAVSTSRRDAAAKGEGNERNAQISLPLAHAPFCALHLARVLLRGGASRRPRSREQVVESRDLERGDRGTRVARAPARRAVLGPSARDLGLGAQPRGRRRAAPERGTTSAGLGAVRLGAIAARRRRGGVVGAAGRGVERGPGGSSAAAAGRARRRRGRARRPRVERAAALGGRGGGGEPRRCAAAPRALRRLRARGLLLLVRSAAASATRAGGNGQRSIVFHQWKSEVDVNTEPNSLEAWVCCSRQVGGSPAGSV